MPGIEEFRRLAGLPLMEQPTTDRKPTAAEVASIPKVVKDIIQKHGGKLDFVTEYRGYKDHLEVEFMWRFDDEEEHSAAHKELKSYKVYVSSDGSLLGITQREFRKFTGEKPYGGTLNQASEDTKKVVEVLKAGVATWTTLAGKAEKAKKHSASAAEDQRIAEKMVSVLNAALRSVQDASERWQGVWDLS